MSTPNSVSLLSCSLVISSFSAALSLSTVFLPIVTSSGEDGIPELISAGTEDARMLLEGEVFLLGKLSGVRIRCSGRLTGDVEVISDNLDGEEVLRKVIFLLIFHLILAFGTGKALLTSELSKTIVSLKFRKKCLLSSEL